MASPPSRPALRERYDRRQQQVVDAAARVFAERGYDQTSVPELADALGVAAGTIYHYFGSKEQLLVRVCDELMDPLLPEAEALVGDGGAPGDVLRALVHLWVSHVVEHRDHMLVFQQERHVIERDGRWRDALAKRKRFERLVDGVLADAQDAGALAGVDRRLALSALLGMVNHTAQWYRPRGRLSAGQIAEGYLDLVLRDAGRRA